MSEESNQNSEKNLDHKLVHGSDHNSKHHSDSNSSLTLSDAALSDSAPKEETFFSHLVELRSRLIRAALSVVIIFLALSPFMKIIFDALSHPLMVALPVGTKLLATGVIAPFMVPLKVTLFVAFALASPLVMYQVWAFVAPGLYQHERKLAVPVLVSSVLMFFLGMAYCYFVVFGFVFKFVAGFAPDSVMVAPDIEAYVSFVLGMFLAFGLTFEVPIVVILIVKLGLVSLEKLKEIRPYIIVGAFILAAVVTPPDVLSQLLLAIPLCLLYQLGLVIAAVVKNKN